MLGTILKIKTIRKFRKFFKFAIIPIGAIGVLGAISYFKQKKEIEDDKRRTYASRVKAHRERMNARNTRNAATYRTSEATHPPKNESVNAKTREDKITFILNTRTMKFHKGGCNGIEKIDDFNKEYFVGTAGELIEKGYSPCARCND